MLDKVRPLSLDLSVVRQYQQEHHYRHPFLMLDSEIIRNKVRRFRAAMPRVQLHFAVKANPDVRVLEIMCDEGCCFEVASRAELDTLLRLKVPARDIFYSNPVKPRSYLSHAAQKGVDWYAVDSVEELRKVHQVKKDARLYLRIYTSNAGSGIELSSKFGAYPAEVTDIIQVATDIGADLAGVTFHVGSQCCNLDNWRTGIRAARQVFDQMLVAGLRPRLLDLGGGYPIDLSEPSPSIEAIAEVINQELHAFSTSVAIMAEPGRYLVADAGCYIAQVIGTTVRQGRHWLFLDAGVHSGLMEFKEGLEFAIESDRKGAKIPWVLAGPTCDSIDVCTHNQCLPETLREGDLLYVLGAGAYTSVCASQFNGFPLPRVVVV